MRVLGIETSCDETAAAVVGRDAEGKPAILSSIVRAQIEDHQEFGGVVPEIAARAHLSALGPVIDQAARSADMELDAIDGIAVTAGPGLIGGLLVGLMTAKGLAASLDKPLIAVNHLEGHALTARLTDDLAYPFVVLLVSGGHTQIVEVLGLGRYRRLATTIDDALGEAFDKTAKLLGLPFPGGPNVEKAARDGDPFRFDLPRPLKGQARLDFSFSGLKTAVRLAAESLQPVTQKDIADLCASFQQAVCEVLSDRVARAIQLVSPEVGSRGPNALVVAGGVAANGHVRSVLKDICQQNGMKFIAPPVSLCGDNGAVIGWAGLERLESGQTSGLDTPARPRWPLDELSEPVLGHGRRGVKV